MIACHAEEISSNSYSATGNGRVHEGVRYVVLIGQYFLRREHMNLKLRLRLV
jgi:hypothetical protein